MPRITYADRFATLLAKDYLSDRDRKFAESLFTSYQRKKVLTAGRRRCFLQLEERYATRPVADDGMVARIEGVRARMSAANDLDGCWADTFSLSLLKQAQTGATLSDRQLSCLRQIEEGWTEAKLKARQSWDQNFSPDMRERFKVAIEYYRKEGYYNNIVSAHRRNPEKIPTQAEYERLTENKYAVKVLTGYFGSPKFEAGSMVALRVSAGWALSQKFPSTIGVVIQPNAMIPASACRGNKVYKLLPVGGTQTVLVEERHLKKVRTPKK